MTSHKAYCCPVHDAGPELLAAAKLALPGFIELHVHGIGCPGCEGELDGPDLAERCPAVRSIDAAIAKVEAQ